MVQFGASSISLELAIRPGIAWLASRFTMMLAVPCRLRNLNVLIEVGVTTAFGAMVYIGALFVLGVRLRT
jgi:hypothetical protein